MTGLDVAESRPLWLSLQHTLPSLGISDIPAYAAAGAVVAAVVAADALVITVDSAVVLVALCDSAGVHAVSSLSFIEKV